MSEFMARGLDQGACGCETPALPPERWARIVFVSDYFDPRIKKAFKAGEVGLYRNVPIGSADWFLLMNPMTDFRFLENPHEGTFVPSNLLRPV